MLNGHHYMEIKSMSKVVVKESTGGVGLLTLIFITLKLAGLIT